MITLIKCSKCHVEKPEDEMTPYRGTGKIVRPRSCKICRKEQADAIAKREKYWLKRDPVKHRENSRKYEREVGKFKRYGITKESYNNQLDFQGSKCAICSRDVDLLHIDHCPDTGLVRGLLCGNCNRGIGIFHHDINRLRNAISYLEMDGIWQY